MNQKRTAIVVTLMALVVMISTAQSQQRLGLGMNLGGQRLYGDRSDVQFSIGMEGLVTYQFLPFADIAFALGYSQLHYILPPSRSSTTDMFNFDLKSSLDIISEGPVKPYVILGLGALASKPLRNSGAGTNWNASLFGGGGFKVRIHPQFDWYLGADYRFVTGDQLDNVFDEGASKDGYLNLRTGVTYYLTNGGYDSPDVLAGERLPFYELEDEPYYYPEQPQSQQGSPNYPPQDTKDMEEYVKLRSRIDELSGTVDAREREISQLQNQLRERKAKIEAKEDLASAQPSKTVRTSPTGSGFSDIYEQALTNYYNKRYSEALALFRNLLQQYPNHALASSCQYWAGRSLFAMTRFDEAITEFLKVSTYGTSLKKDDALFYMGRAYLKLGSGQEAKERFSQLIQNYPTSEFVPEARNYLGKL